MAQSVGCQGIEMTSAFGRAADVHKRTTSAAFDANDPERTSRCFASGAEIGDLCTAQGGFRPNSDVRPHGA